MHSIETDLTKHKYMIAMPCYDGMVHVTTTNSLIKTSAYLNSNGVPFHFNLIRGGALIDAVRNDLALTFLQSDCDTIVWIDADISWEIKDIERLLVFSHHYPIVSGAYTCKTDPPKFLITFDDHKPDENGLYKVASLGLGFTAVQRQVFEKLKETTEHYEDPHKGVQVPAFFRIMLKNGLYVGEDIHFFQEAKKAGFQAYLDPEINLEHTGLKTFNTKLSEVLYGNSGSISKE